MSLPRSEGLAQLKEWCTQGDIGCLFLSTQPTQKELDLFWEELHYYLPSQLDRLLSALTGQQAFNSTKESALKKLRPLLLALFPKREFTDPEFILREQRRNVVKRERSVLPEDEATDDEVQSTTEEQTMSTVEIKSTETTPKATKKKAAAKKPNVKALKKANPVATKSLTKPGRPKADKSEAKITLLVKENPHREGTETYEMFQKIQKCKTVGDFFKKGGTPLYLRWFVNHDEVSVK